MHASEIQNPETTGHAVSEENQYKSVKKNKNVRLIAENKLILHTNVARSLFEGSWNYKQFGLVQFAKMVRLIWQASGEDDPYAEWMLLRIYEAIEEAKTLIKQYEQNIEAQFNNLRGFKIELFKNPEPFEQPLRFGTPFAFMAAMLLENFDYVNRQLYTLQRIGMLPADKLSVSQLVRKLKSVFVLAAEWKHTGVTRKDIHDNNQRAQKAKTLLGEVPLKIVNKEIKFAFLPKTRETKENSSSEEKKDK